MGLYGIAEVKMVKDNWNVEWKIEDETIAKCVPESGIENNEYGGTQIAGRASIQGLKEGTTKLLIKVKVSESKTKDFEVPITITGHGVMCNHLHYCSKKPIKVCNIVHLDTQTNHIHLLSGTVSDYHMKLYRIYSTN